MFDSLKNFQVDRHTLEETIFTRALLRMFRAELEEHGVDALDWVVAKERTLTREINNRNQDNLERLLAEKKARYEATKPEATKRSELAAEIKRLEKLVGATA